MTTQPDNVSTLPAAVPAPRAAGAMTYSRDGGITPTNFDEAWRLAQLFARSNLVPKDYRDQPENCLVAMQMGAEVGLKPLQALQGIAVINGRPSIWGDALWALVQNSPIVEDETESYDEKTKTATCRIKRKDRSEATVQSFSEADARTAGLWGKQGPWTTNPRRMLQMRARAFAARDAVPDVLKGLAVAEEALDIPPEREINPATTEPVRGTAALAAARDRAKAAETVPDAAVAPPPAEAATLAEPAGSASPPAEAQPASQQDPSESLASKVADAIAFLDVCDTVEEISKFADDPDTSDAVRASPEFARAVAARLEKIKARRPKK